MKAESTRRRLAVKALGLATAAPAAWVATAAHAHHGWSSFDQDRPLYLQGRALEVQWRNPHVELVLQRDAGGLPPDLASRPVPAQAAQVDGRSLLSRATLPRRGDARWLVELAPLTRMEQWRVAEIKAGTDLAVLGFAFAQEKGEPILRAEYLFLAGQVYGLRSRPA